jgi:shikimate dehydrogenase
VLGAGGAARAVAAALGSAGAAEVAVVARSSAAADHAAALAAGRGRVAGPEALAGADLIVNATPVGMAGHAAAGAEPLVPASAISAGQVVVDLVYEPPVTDWMTQAAERGATVLGGLGMLVHQAAAQLALWTGTEPPVEAMWSAAQTALEARSATTRPS